MTFRFRGPPLPSDQLGAVLLNLDGSTAGLHPDRRNWLALSRSSCAAESADSDDGSNTGNAAACMMITTCRDHWEADASPIDDRDRVRDRVSGGVSMSERATVDRNLAWCTAS